MRSSTSLPRKSTVPWQRYAEEAAAAQGELYAIRPLEKVTPGAGGSQTHRGAVPSVPLPTPSSSPSSTGG